MAQEEDGIIGGGDVRAKGLRVEDVMHDGLGGYEGEAGAGRGGGGGLRGWRGCHRGVALGAGDHEILVLVRVLIGPEHGALAERLVGGAANDDLLDALDGEEFGAADGPGPLEVGAGTEVVDEAAKAGDDGLVLGADDNEAAHADEHEEGKDQQRGEGFAEELVEPAAGDFEAELVVDGFVDDAGEGFGAGEKAEDAGVEGGTGKLAGATGAVSAENEQKESFEAEGEHDGGDEGGEDGEEGRRAEVGGESGDEEEGHDEDAAHEVAGAAAEHLPLAEAGHAGDIAGDDESDEASGGSEEGEAEGRGLGPQRDGLEVGEGPGGAGFLDAGSGAGSGFGGVGEGRGEAEEHQAAHSEQVKGQEETYERQAEAVEAGEAAASEGKLLLPFVEKGGGAVVGGELLGFQGLGALEAVLLINEQKDEPEGQAAQEVPGGGVNGGAGGPEAHEGGGDGQ